MGNKSLKHKRFKLTRENFREYLAFKKAFDDKLSSDPKFKADWSEYVRKICQMP